MSIQSISFDRVAAFSSAEGGDPSAYVKAMLGLTQEGVMGARRESIASAKDQLADRARLLSIKKLLDSLQTMSDGKGIVLGGTLAAGEATKAQLSTLGVTLATEKSYYITVATFDANGAAIAGTKQIATPTQKAAAEAATLTTAADANGVEVRTSGTGNARKVYTLYKKEEALTASTADLAGLRTAVAGSLLVNVAALEKTLTLPGALAVESSEFEQRLLKELSARDKVADVAKQDKQRDTSVDYEKQLVERQRERDLFDNFKANRTPAEVRANPSSPKQE
ncbi:hypothetical protein [Caenimonas sp. SL110]|uniref:hypothetical protein n=1 Tax=Caenimonas sp. SL110 TaxID=1450524 RepID=UPI0006542049|nr:hypothetical protein [Caenimonas sp. SL110]